MIRKLLEEGDLPRGDHASGAVPVAVLGAVCVPVTMVNHMSMFPGITARGWKGMDPFYLFTNPSPAYEVTFLSKLPRELTCGSGQKSSHEVANYIQSMIAVPLSYECMGFTRKHKYKALAVNDMVVADKPKVQLQTNVMGC